MIKTILVPICHEEGADQRIDFAIELANQFDAHIKALHILTPLETMIRSTSVDSIYSIDAYTKFQKDAVEEAGKLRKKYEKKLKSAGVKFDWCQEKGDILSHFYIYSRTSDVSIISQKTAGFEDMLDHMNDFVIDSGLPVIAIPKKGVESYQGKNILVAWDGSNECAKATHLAIPLLKKASKVTVVTIAEEHKDQVPAADICIHLSRHGVKAEALTLSGDVPAKQRILDTAESLNSDLIVAGAWGHNRLREMVFGGVTRNLLTNQKRPVFLAK